MLKIHSVDTTSSGGMPIDPPAEMNLRTLASALRDPRAAVRGTWRSPGEAALWLGALAGIASISVSGDVAALERVHGSVWPVLLPVVVAAVPLGVLWVYVEAVWTWVGARALGASAPSVHHLASAAAWGGLPLAVLLLPVKLVVWTLWWQGALMQHPWAWMTLEVVTAVGTLWSLGATAAAVGEVLGTGTLRGLLAYAMVPAGLILLGLALVAGMG